MIPADIDNKQFKTTRVKEGYDQDEVDDFLDAIKVEWEADRRGNEEKNAEIIRLKRQLKEAQRIADAYDLTAPIPAPSPAESATRILEFAQKTADDVVAEAKAQADEMTAAARNECKAMKNEARGTVYQLEQEAKALEAKVADTREYVRGYLRRALNELEESGG